jgi:type IV pilus assembly protein PilC
MKQISATDIMLFMRQFATLLAAGVPATRSCDIIESSQQHLGLSSFLHQLKHDMLAGKSLHAGFNRYRDHFDPLICHLIKVGEETGQLDSSLLHIADYLEKRHALKKQIQRALFYPALTALIALLITTGMLLFVIPRFAELFQTSSVVLPWWTRCIFALSSFARHQGAILLLLLAAAAVIIFYSLPSARQWHTWHTLFTHLPIANTVLQQKSLTSFTHSLAMSFSAGITLPDAIALCFSDTSPLTPTLYQLQTSILAGLPLHKSMQPLTCFPAYMVQMIKVGEESGKLDAMLLHIADKMEADLAHHLNQLSQLLEPLIMLILGVVIGGLVIGMYLPIFKLGSALS